MKKSCLLLLALLFTAVTFAQKREKIKGSKNVTVAKKEVAAFDSLEIEDNLEVYLTKGTEQGLEIEADDNLHDVIQADIHGGTLRLYTNKEVSGAKKITVRINYTGELKSIIAKHQVMLYALTELEVEDITIKNLDFSKSFLNVKAGSFSLSLNDKTTAEINVKAESTTIDLSKNADLKALIATQNLKMDMYQKTTAAIEGDAAAMQLRVDNNAVFTGKKFSVKNASLVAESYTKCSITVAETLDMEVTGKTEIELYGAPTSVTMKKFADSAIIYKKEL
ncbi:GIN domain-containing protein [Flavobacterium subsaxonicum]|uniref:Putative auto-transporter adhesin head GIN domain-containing protein n=1 Tax=Flavobacterium subsaxonicum WB 4.1-42 = DSM 21790 TaxID=1121898 RepID=A0A0A2MJH5_9FLAO|nr:DUF2807 domain-containing protein [Flavobacterium subsaxonicum]KGO92454.1 hypothetical protein Q766_13435 [Flavobacterium subsaxonicum WB 4.1-42 = DSM 21790]